MRYSLGDTHRQAAKQSTCHHLTCLKCACGTARTECNFFKVSHPVRYRTGMFQGCACSIRIRPLSRQVSIQHRTSMPQGCEYTNEYSKCVVSWVSHENDLKVGFNSWCRPTVSIDQSTFSWAYITKDIAVKLRHYRRVCAEIICCGTHHMDSNIPRVSWDSTDLSKGTQGCKVLLEVSITVSCPRSHFSSEMRTLQWED